MVHSPEDCDYIHPQVQKLLTLPRHAQRSDEWFALRHQKLTGSDAASALGINVYSNAEELLFKKNDIFIPFETNIACEWGVRYEDEACEAYEKLTGKKVFEFGLLAAPHIDWLAGSPDGVTSDGVLIEIKCPFRRKIIPGEIPAYYLPQVQCNMEVMDLEICHFIQYVPRRGKIKPFMDIKSIPRDRAWFAKNGPIMKKFWDDVLHYRDIGIEKHPSYTKWINKIAKHHERKSAKLAKLEIEKRQNQLESVIEEKELEYLFDDTVDEKQKKQRKPKAPRAPKKPKKVEYLFDDTLDEKPEQVYLFDR